MLPYHKVGFPMADEHECSICGASFDDEDELMAHNEKQHGDETEE